MSEDKWIPLSEVTQEHAVEIVKAAYSSFFKTGLLKLTDQSNEIGEPCKKLKAVGKAYLFWFFNDKIDIDLEDDNVPITFDDVNFDVKCACYIKAAQLGYYVPLLSEMLPSPPKPTHQ